MGSRGEMLSWRARLSAVALPLPQNRGAQEVLSLRWEAAPHPATGCTASSGGRTGSRGAKRCPLPEGCARTAHGTIRAEV